MGDLTIKGLSATPRIDVTLIQTGEIKPATPELLLRFKQELGELPASKLGKGKPSDIRVPGDNPDEVKTRKGYPATAEKPTTEEQINGVQKAVKVKQEQVKAFLDLMAPYGLGIKESDICTSKGVLNPNFELKNGKICFKEGMMKKYLEGTQPKYFETYSGQWAKPADEDLAQNDDKKTIDIGDAGLKPISTKPISWKDLGFPENSKPVKWNDFAANDTEKKLYKSTQGIPITSEQTKYVM